MQQIGVDIIEIERIEHAIQRFGQNFLKRVYTERELEAYRQTASLAARFAAKEAVMKTLDSPAWGISFKEIEILSNANGKPFVLLHGKAQQYARKLDLSAFAVSLSHCRDYAVAMVLASS